MERVYVTYRLRSKEHVEAYERWSRERDQVVVREQPGVLGFDVYMVEDADSREAGGGAYDIVEEITVSSWDEFQRALETEPLQQLGQEFAEVADPGSVTTLRTRRL
jgi:hypothetical protein